MKTLIALALCLSTFTAHADDWSRADIQREAAYLAVQAVDWSQTLQIRQHPEMIELNPILGPHPTNSKVNLYMLGAAALHVIVADQLPSKWREAFQVVSITVEASVVAHNFSMGLGIRF